MKIGAEKMKQDRHVMTRNKRELVRNIMEYRYQKMCSGRHCKENKSSKAKIVWTRNKKR